jgi:hypothetical protein
VQRKLHFKRRLQARTRQTHRIELRLPFAGQNDKIPQTFLKEARVKERIAKNVAATWNATPGAAARQRCVKQELCKRVTGHNMAKNA